MRIRDRVFSDLSQEDVKRIPTAAPSMALFRYPGRNISYKGNIIMNFPRRWAKLEKNSHQRALCKSPHSHLSYASAQTPIFLPSTVLLLASLGGKINSTVKHELSVSFHIPPNHYISSYIKAFFCQENQNTLQHSSSWWKVLVISPIMCVCH